MGDYQKLVSSKNEYVFVDGTLNIKLKNDELLRNYVYYKFTRALERRKLFESEFNDNLIHDFLMLVQNDINNASFPDYNVEISTSELKLRRERSIKINYLGWMLGNVYRNTQLNYLKNKIPIERLSFNGSNISLFNEALAQVEDKYLSSAIHDENSFSVTSLMVSLFELTLKSTTRRVLLDKLNLEMKKKNLSCELLDRVNDHDESLYKEKNVMHKIYKFLVDNQVIIENHAHYKELLKLIIENKYSKPLTLNSLLYNQIFKELCKDDWYRFLRILFIDLDYRNNVAHCNFDYNYYDVNLTAILYQLFHMVARRTIYKPDLQSDLNAQ